MIPEWLRILKELEEESNARSDTTRQDSEHHMQNDTHAIKLLTSL